jgi:hypothetical protein
LKTDDENSLLPNPIGTFRRVADGKADEVADVIAQLLPKVENASVEELDELLGDIVDQVHPDGSLLDALRRSADRLADDGRSGPGRPS